MAKIAAFDLWLPFWINARAFRLIVNHKSLQNSSILLDFKMIFLGVKNRVCVVYRTSVFTRDGKCEEQFMYLHSMNKDSTKIIGQSTETDAEGYVKNYSSF